MYCKVKWDCGSMSAAHHDWTNGTGNTEFYNNTKWHSIQCGSGTLFWCLCLLSLPPKTFHPASLKPRITVAICCQGDQTTTTCHSWQTSSHSHAEGLYGSWFTLSTALIFKKQNQVWFGFILARRKIGWHQHKPSICSKSRFFLKFLPLPSTLHKIAGLDVLFLCIFFLVNYLVFLVLFFCIL